MPVPLTILLIEDDENDYELTKGLLPNGKTQIVWAQTLKIALQEISKQLFDVVLVDLGVPDSQGLCTLDRIAEAFQQMPVLIVLTGNDDDEIAQNALKRGAQDYLVKGQVNSELLQRSLRYAIERHKIETQLRKSNDELIIVNHALIVARDTAIDASRTKSEFLANISHEIRTPLSGMVSIAELLTLEDCSPDVNELHQVLLQSSKHLVTTLNDLLDLSKLEAGRMVINITDVDIRAIVKEVLMIIEPTAKRKQLLVDSVISEAVPILISSDSLRLKQILLNFVHNAVKFTHEGSVQICSDVELRGDNHLICVSVKDTGIGIAEDSKTRIFEPFIQADAALNRKYGGTGLGLAISKKSAELLGAEIGFDSEFGKGSNFWLKIPTVV
ncbi:MAG: ATP-binding protein [Candidatus Obscuribacterales bacterium]|nr:ATP-binding protein [Candidatus Obscuribacterales bacterium]